MNCAAGATLCWARFCAALVSDARSACIRFEIPLLILLSPVYSTLVPHVYHIQIARKQQAPRCLSVSRCVPSNDTSRLMLRRCHSLVRKSAYAWCSMPGPRCGGGVSDAGVGVGALTQFPVAGNCSLAAN